MKPVWFVDVLERTTQKIVKTLGPYPSERSAEKAESGLLINMNRAEYFTLTRSEP